MGAHISLNGDGTLHYDPTASSILTGLGNRDTLTDVFTYQSQDEHGALSNSASVAVDVHGSLITNDFVLHNGDVEHHISGFSNTSGGDVLDLRDLLAGSGVAADGSNLSDFVQVANSGSDTAVYVDADGTGAGAAREVATLVGLSNLLLGDLTTNHNLLYA